MKIAVLAPIAWRTPPRHYGPWEQVASILTEGLVHRGIETTLYATLDSVTSARLMGVCQYPYEENEDIDPKVWECLHISELMENSSEYDVIHNNYDFLPLSYSGLIKTPLVTTIHGFSCDKILPVYQKYNEKTWYVSISNADRCEGLDYIRTVYHGIEVKKFNFNKQPSDYLLYFGRIHPDKGTYEAIQVAKKANKNLIIAGIIQDMDYFEELIKPLVDGDQIKYIGSVGRENKSQVLAGAYALLHPINFEEPFGLSVIESMACGTPVIAFEKGSMPEIIKDGINGYLVSNIEEMAERINDISSIERKSCRKNVEENFSSERMVDNYIDVYKEILNG